MDKVELFRLVLELVAGGLVIFLASKNFKFKEALVKVIEAAKDGKVTEEEFQGIVDEVKKEIYG
jgi:hypothetical protein